MDVGPDGLLYVLDTKPSVSVIDPSTGQVVRAWGRQGTGRGEFDLRVADDNPGVGDIAVASDGRVYVADGSNHRVQVFTSEGKFLQQFGAFGAGDAQFGSVAEIDIGPDGSVYVFDGRPRPLSKFTADGKFAWRSPDPSTDPFLTDILHGVAVETDGTVLLSCETCGHILVFDPADGHLSARWKTPELTPGGQLAVDNEGNIYAGQWETEALLAFDKGGTFLGGRYLGPGDKRTALQSDTEWGDGFWPVPVVLPDGRAFAFSKDGLVELKVSLPDR